MKIQTEQLNQHLEEAKNMASLLMHMHYCDNNAQEVSDFFAPQFIWLGAGEEQYIAGAEAASMMFRRFKDAIPKCDIWDEEYHAIEPAPGVYVVSGRMWIATAPGVELYLKVHQRVTFVFQKTDQGLKCAHIHCSNPYQELVDKELFPEKIGRQSYEYVQERLKDLEEKNIQQNRQMDVIMSSIAGGLKISNDDETYSFAFVSKEAAGLFGYTVEEFMKVTGGTAVGTVYPPDLEHALADCAEAFRDGGLSYATRYRVRCKDGSLKWIMDSGKKAQDSEGNWMVNSLYLDVTKAEEDARRIQKQAQLLSSIYDTVPCGIIRFIRHADGACELISLNRAVVQLMGYANLEEAVCDWHNGVLGAVIKEDRTLLRNTYDLLQQIGERQDREYRVRWKDGKLHWLEGTNMFVDRTAQGDAVIQRTMVDVTRRRKLQQQLEQEQEMYRVAMESSSDTMFEYLLDTDTFISYEPKPGQGVIRREMAGYSKLLSDKDFIHPEDVQAVRENICEGRQEVFEIRITTPYTVPGDYRWHRVSSRLISRNGLPWRVVGTARNIHSMKETLSENQERLHMSQSALQAISNFYDSILYVNVTEDRYYAVRLPDAYATGLSEHTGCFSKKLAECQLLYIKEEDRAKVAQVCDRERILQEFSKISGHAEVEFRMNPVKGQEVCWMHLEIHPIFSEDEEMKTAIITLRNVSGEKQRELERREEERAAKQALEEAYEGARRANLAKSEFLSRMSHDIRTPMNAILGMAAIAEKQLGNQEKIEDCLEKIRVSGNHLLGLINEVLDMSKIESGNENLDESTFTISNTLDTVLQIIRPDAERKRQHLMFQSAVGNDVVNGDTMRVQQILLNLLSNAIKYTEEGGHIHLKAEEKSSGRSGIGCFEFTVEDDGMGMTPEFLKKIFSPFERAEDVRVQKVQGTGLGLSITNNLVQMMNGTIHVESQLNQGTRFVVTIFLKLAEAETYVPLEHDENTPQPIRAFKPDTRILLAEDNDMNREIAQELLGMAGLKTACAVDGLEAVRLFSENPAGTYDLILMDIQMPGMNGYEATEAIRRLGESGKRPDAATIPIIALTANAFADDAYRAKKAGMNEHVAKPLDIDQLLETLHRWLD